MQASNEGAAIRVSSTDQRRLIGVLREVGEGAVPTVFDLKLKPEHATREKWDWALPDRLRLRSFESAQLDLLGAQRLASALSQTSCEPPY